MKDVDSTAPAGDKRPALDQDFTSVLQKSPNPGGWTYVVMAGSADYFGTRGLVRFRGTITATSSRARSWRSGTAPTSCR